MDCRQGGWTYSLVKNYEKRLILPLPFALVEIFRIHIPFFSSSSLHSSFFSIVRTKTTCQWIELNRGSCRIKEKRFFTRWHHNETQSREDACRRVYKRSSAGCRCFFPFFFVFRFSLPFLSDVYSIIAGKFDLTRRFHGRRINNARGTRDPTVHVPPQHRIHACTLRRIDHPYNPL